MKKNNIGYLLREGFRGVFLHGFMSFAAICVTVACLIIMGSFCLILYNTSAMVKELEQKNEMLVYIDESYSEAKAKSVGSQINLITNVRSAVFVSREQALEDFIDEQNDASLFAGIDPDTLRDRYVVTVEDNSLLKQTYEKLKDIEGVADVSAHFEIAEGFQTVQNVLNIASLVIVSVLFVVSLFIISNTVKLAMYSRSEEIAIMKMVGATNAGGWLYPLPYQCQVTDSYGYRTHPLTGKYSWHNGVDFGAAAGTAILATKSGTVTTAAYSAAWGYYVVINHGDGYSSLYAHQPSCSVSVGDYVTQGQTIGYVGSTGWSTGPHLHFTIYYNGADVNPFNYIG